MIFADYQFYIDDYLQGDEPLIPEKSFMRWAEKASSRINKFNVSDDVIIEKLETIREETYNNLLIGTCEIAEIMYTDNQSRSKDAIHSYSNQGLTKTYVNQIRKKEEVESDIRQVIIDRVSSGELHNLFVSRAR